MDREYDFETYQHDANLVDVLSGFEAQYTFYCIGLSGEVGELLNKIKKNMRFIDGYSEKIISKEELLDEAGDVLWYLTRLIHKLGGSLQEVAKQNMDKLNKRMKNGTLFER